MAGFTPAVRTRSTASVVQPTVTGSGVERSLTLHGFRSCLDGLLVHQCPRPFLLARVLALTVLKCVVFGEPPIQIVRLAHTATARRTILDDVDEERQSPRVGLEPTT